MMSGRGVKGQRPRRLRPWRTLLFRERLDPRGSQNRCFGPVVLSERPGFRGLHSFTSSLQTRGRNHRARSHVLASTRSFQWGKGSETEQRKPWSLTASGKRWVGTRIGAIAASPRVPGPRQDAVMHHREGKMCRQVDLESAIRESAPATPRFIFKNDHKCLMVEKEGS